MAKPKTAKREYKLDIRTLLEAVDQGRREFYQNLTDEEKKGFVPVVAIRWLSSLPDNNPLKEYALLAVNDLVNNSVWSLGKHPELLYLLMTVAGSGQKMYHPWIAGISRKTSSTPRFDALLNSLYLGCNSEEIALARTQYSVEQAVELALRSGLDDRGVKEIRDELKKVKQGN